MMRLPCAALLLFVPAALSAQESSSDSAMPDGVAPVLKRFDADTLVALAQEWTDTWNEKDVERMGRLHADDLSNVLYGWRDGFGTVEELLEEARRENFWNVTWNIEMVEPRVRALGADVAVVSFRLVGDDTHEGVTRPYAAAMSLVFQRQGGEWQIVHLHESSAPEPAPEQP